MKKIEIQVPSLKKQEKFIKDKKTDKDDDQFDDCDKIPESWKPFNEGYTPPNAEEIRKTFGDFSSTELANMLGLSDGRIIRRWKSGENQIPYAAWRLFLIITERVVLF